MPAAENVAAQSRRRSASPSVPAFPVHVVPTARRRSTAIYPTQAFCAGHPVTGRPPTGGSARFPGWRGRVRPAAGRVTGRTNASQIDRSFAAPSARQSRRPHGWWMSHFRRRDGPRPKGFVVAARNDGTPAPRLIEDREPPASTRWQFSIPRSRHTETRAQENPEAVLFRTRGMFRPHLTNVSDSSSGCPVEEHRAPGPANRTVNLRVLSGRRRHPRSQPRWAKAGWRSAHVRVRRQTHRLVASQTKPSRWRTRFPPPSFVRYILVHVKGGPNSPKFLGRAQTTSSDPERKPPRSFADLSSAWRGSRGDPGTHTSSCRERL